MAKTETVVVLLQQVEKSSFLQLQSCEELLKCNDDVLICSFEVKKKFLIQVLYLLLDDKYLDVGWSVHDAFLDVRCVCFLLILPPTHYLYK